MERKTRTFLVVLEHHAESCQAKRTKVKKLIEIRRLIYRKEDMQYQRLIHADAAGQQPKFLVESLIAKYGTENLVSPIILGNRNGDQPPICYIYERNYQNQVNNPHDNRPSSNSSVPSVFLDYTKKNRELTGSVPQEIRQLFEKRYKRSYDFILARGKELFTVDIDLMWQREGAWRALEFTTFEQPLFSEERAKQLVSTLHRRPTWGNEQGHVALNSIVEATRDLNATLRMVIVNSTKGVNRGYRVDGNAFWFPLSHQQIERLYVGEPPEEGIFGTVSQFLSAL